MEIRWLVMVCVSICTLLLLLLWLFDGSRRKLCLPPGPTTVPIIGSITLLRKSSVELELVLRRLHSLLGPIVTLRIGPRLAVFVLDRSLARQALVLSGATFAHRPAPVPTARATGATSISASSYGPMWRTLRRNLTSEMLHPSRFRSFSTARASALSLLVRRLSSSSNEPVIDHFSSAFFHLLALMCYGDSLDEPTVEDIKRVQRRLLLNFRRFNILNFMPTLTKIVLRGRWRELAQLRRDQSAVLGPIIKARIDKYKQGRPMSCYVDTLMQLQVPAEEDDPGMTRKLELSEMVTLTSEFLTGGTDTTATALQWIMANLVKHPEIQDRVHAEILQEVRPDGDEILSEEVGRLWYLKAVVLEALRRHPPAHFVLPHAVTEDVELGGYLIPKKGIINFMVAEMGWDPAVWDDPMAFKPERFLEGEGIHVFSDKKTGEIKMMPFGAGRRICPGADLALLHLLYFVANLVWKFRWSPDPDHPVDLAEKQELTIVMKHPLHACLSSRRT